ncbi:MAG: DAK2 domain-containing protein [Clostridia bacterium]|nr:DAK2 domain-containing protein [Clostridia bacterium]
MFSGDILRDAIISGSNNIFNERQRVDELNVFPVPDGDTGTNMSMSIGNAARELSKQAGKNAGEIAKIAASALLRGARGNSGVITSLLFRGISKGIGSSEEVTAENLVAALSAGVEAAYKAVMKPTEGTILTVARIAAEEAKKALSAGADALGVFKAALEGAKVALDDTPNLLPTLKKAGVVDAGGRGLVVIFEGMLSVFENGKIIQISGETEAAIDNGEGDAARNAAAEFEGEITFTYCTEFIVNRKEDKADSDAADLRAYLETIGDCVVVVDDEDIIKTHVHTDHPGNALEKALTFGQLVNLKIENMRDQHERAKHDSENAKKKPVNNSTNTEKITSVEPTEEFGFVSVCVGEGLENLFRELGVNTIVSGGQTMNPSTDDILKAIEQTPAKTVFVLPNNKNIIMAAEQAIPLASRKVIVLPTRTIPMGISAVIAFDPDLSDEKNAIAMQNAFSNVSTGQITFAARDSDFDGLKIKKDDLMAMENGKIIFTDSDLTHCAVKLCQKMCKKDVSFLTIIFGEDVSENTANRVQAELNEKFGGKIEITVINGGQPVYYFIISAE